MVAGVFRHAEFKSGPIMAFDLFWANSLPSWGFGFFFVQTHDGFTSFLQHAKFCVRIGTQIFQAYISWLLSQPTVSGVQSIFLMTFLINKLHDKVESVLIKKWDILFVNQK